MREIRMAKTCEIREYLEKIDFKSEVEVSGLPLYYDKDDMYINTNSHHNLIIGANGSGKTQVTILPKIKLAAMAGEGMIVNDPFGELYKTTAVGLKEKGYDVRVIDFKDARCGDAWNPLVLPYKFYKNKEYDKAIDMIENVAYYLCYDKNEANVDPFWTNSVVSYFTGLALYLFENANEDEINLSSIYKLGFDLVSPEGHKVLEKLDRTGSIYLNLASIVTAPPETKSSIISVFGQKMKFYLARVFLAGMLSNNDIDLLNITNKKTAIFLINDEADYSSNLITLFVHQAFDAIAYSEKTKKFNMILDQFANLIPLRNYGTLLSLARSLNVEFTVTVANFFTLDKTYSKEERINLCGQFANIIYLLSDDEEMLDFVSKACGSNLVNDSYVPIISIDELRRLNTFEAVVLPYKANSFRSILVPDYKIDWDFSREVLDEVFTGNRFETKIFSEI